MQSAFAVAKSDNAGGIDEVQFGEHPNGLGQFVEMRLHAHPSDKLRDVFSRVRPGCPLVIAERCDPGTGKRLCEEPPAAVGAGKER